MAVRLALFADTIGMALGTIRANKMRSGLTVLGVVIGITAIVGMSSIIRGFDNSFRDLIRELGPSTIIVARVSFASAGSGIDRKELMKRPNLTIEDARVLQAEIPSLQAVDAWVQGQERMFYRSEKTQSISILGASEKFTDINFLKIEQGRFFTENEVTHRRNVVVIGQVPFKAFFGNTDALGKVIRIGSTQYTVVGVAAPRPSIGGLGNQQDALAVIPYTTFAKLFGTVATGGRRRTGRSAQIFCVPKEGVSREAAMREVETVMRIRHKLKLNQPNDFDVATQDMALKFFDQATGAIYLALVVISSIALMVGGIGVMAIMMISVTERTREIGVRKALGARRREILWQFLLEAVVLTSVGGILGVIIGAAVGVSVRTFTPLPVSMPWWSFAIGFAFSASVGIFFGLFPAFRASRLDPIEALRYE
ncbi:MAG TPA: ABC transporter permease [Vicinamibacterales bacterium]|jgi:putative ABC transport system permease protein